VARTVPRRRRTGGPYLAPVHPPPAPVVTRRPPVAALLAAPLAVLSAVVVALFGFLALAFSNGDLGGDRWMIVAVPAVLSIVLVVGALLLLVGRSWLAVVLPAGALSLAVVTSILSGSLGEDTGGFLALCWGLPGISAVLAALPGVRRWVAARRDARQDAREVRRNPQPVPGW
jgi:hypothetical protein